MSGLERQLRADCSRCAGLCCVAPAFAASADFAIDKPAGSPCPNLRSDSGCGIHARLRESGFPGCAVFDCFGAGQQVVQVTFGGADWRGQPDLARSMFAVFGVVRVLHELLWYLLDARAQLEAQARLARGSLAGEVERLRAETEQLAGADRRVLEALDPGVLRREAGPLLGRVSEAVRAGASGPRPDHTGADLVGARMPGADLRGGSLRGAYLIGADLRGADLRGADLLGADLRAAVLRGARLDGALFLTQTQLEAAVGDAQTTLPGAGGGLVRPLHWAATQRSRRRR